MLSQFVVILDMVHIRARAHEQRFTFSIKRNFIGQYSYVVNRNDIVTGTLIIVLHL